MIPQLAVREFRRAACGAAGQVGFTYEQMSLKVHFCKTTLSSAANGWQLPTLPVTLAYVRACNGPEGEWRVLWQQAWDLLQSQNGRNHG